jgi:hypothetical protein
MVIPVDLAIEQVIQVAGPGPVSTTAGKLIAAGVTCFLAHDGHSAT